MGINLHGIASQLGLANPSTPIGMATHALLGPQAINPDVGYTATPGSVATATPGATGAPAPLAQPSPVPAGTPPGAVPETSAPDVVVNGAHNPAAPQGGQPPMSVAGMGMPALNLAGVADPSSQSVSDLHDALQQKAELARQLYNPGSEFGTHGILRDVVGNVEDFGRRLLGFAPRYNDEKWAEKAYGMSDTSNPALAAAATEQGMQYNPAKTEAYQQQLVSQHAQEANSAATTEFKNAQAQGRYANILSGLGSSLMAGNFGQDPTIAQANYERMKPAIQQQLDRLYGPGVNVAPDQYTDSFARSLSNTGFTGTNVERFQQGVMSAQNQRDIQQMRGDIQLKVQGMRGQSLIQAANIMNNGRMSIADKEQALRLLPTEVDTTVSPSGTIIQPTINKQTTTTRGGVPQGAPPAPQGHSMTGTSKSGRAIYSSDGGHSWSYSKQ